MSNMVSTKLFQKLKDALETAAAEHDKEYEKWEEERKELKVIITVRVIQKVD